MACALFSFQSADIFAWCGFVAAVILSQGHARDDLQVLTFKTI